MSKVTISNINAEELRNIRNTLTEMQGKDSIMSLLNEKQAEAIEGLLSLTDAIKDAMDTEKDDSICPVCHGSDIQGGATEMDGNGCFQPCTCACGASWNNYYDFSGSSDIQEG